MKLSDYIADFLYAKGIDTVFGYQGGMITHVIDSLYRHPGMRFVQTYHEQTAAFAAEGWAIGKSSTGVAMSSSGPGATNLITGMADAWQSGIPVIFITGQVNTYEYKYDKPIRQQGFQELDVVSLAQSITKYAKLVDCADDIAYELEKAYFLANDGRKGPVLLDIPMDITRAEIDPSTLHHYTPKPTEYPDTDFTTIENLIRGAKRPLILLGGGAKADKEKISLFVHRHQIPVVVSMIGKGAFDESDPLFVGMVGSYGNRCANMAISRCDVLIALGTRLDTRQTGARRDAFMPDGTVIHVNIDHDELIHHRLTNRVNVHLPIDRFLDGMADLSYKTDTGWIDWIEEIVSKYNQEAEISRFVKDKAPYLLFEAINRISLSNDTFISDIGQNQIFAAQTLKVCGDQDYICNASLASMGSALPLSIGYAMARPERRVLCFAGDGGVHMSSQSLMLISQYELDIKITVLDNRSLGMITQFQELYFDARYAGSVAEGGYLTPHFKLMAQAYGIPYREIEITDNEEINAANIQKAYEATRNILIDVPLANLTKVSPKLEFSSPIYDPLPHLPADELLNLDFKPE